MKKSATALVLSGALVATLAGVSPAQAARSYANCTVLHRDHRYGVASSVKAATKQVRTNHYRATVNRALYVANDNLDADKGGTACEVTS